MNLNSAKVDMFSAHAHTKGSEECSSSTVKLDMDQGPLLTSPRAECHRWQATDENPSLSHSKSANPIKPVHHLRKSSCTICSSWYEGKNLTPTTVLKNGTSTSPKPTHERNNKGSAGSEGESTRQPDYSIISCCDFFAMGQIDNANCAINFLKDKLLKNIFAYLNHSDLLNCRAVQRRWRALISQDDTFLETTLFAVTIRRTYNVETDTVTYNDELEYVKLPFRNGRFQYLDYQFWKEPQYFSILNSDNERYFPNSDFLRKLTSLEFRNCYLLWTTLKRILVKTTSLENLTISHCFVSDVVYKSETLNEFQDFTAGNVIFGLKKLELYETRFLNNITKILKKMTGYSVQGLTTLKITYYPPLDRKVAEDSKSDCYDFCRELKSLITLCAHALDTLFLDIQHEPTLDLLGYHLGKELQALGSKLNLKEFQLSPSLGVWLNSLEQIPKRDVAMTMKTIGVDSQKCMKGAATSLARFLESQTNLSKLGLPCIEYPEAYSSCFKSVLQRLPCAECLTYLAVPCAGFLPEDFLHQFPNLRGLKIGASCCGDNTSGWNVFGDQTSSPSELDFSRPNLQGKSLTQEGQESVSEKRPNFLETREMLKNMKELSISTLARIDKFGQIAQRLLSLTELELNSGPNTPIFEDNDLQACIKYLKTLRILKISCCDNLTDFGITGIPNKICQLMFKHQKYYIEGINLNIWSSEKVPGRPLSDLKGLKQIVMLGCCSFTDIGLGYGLAFNELKYCYLPYSDKITSWGIARFSSVNPSLESLILAGVNQTIKGTFLKARRTHDRLRKGNASSSGYFNVYDSEFVDDFSLILPTPQEVITSLVLYCTSKIHAVLSILGTKSQNCGTEKEPRDE